MPTLQEYAERWLQSSAQVHKLGTSESYQQRLRTVWLAALGSQRLDRITRAHIKKILMDKLAAGYKVNAVL
jgi:hypothetical protein